MPIQITITFPLTESEKDLVNDVMEGYESAEEKTDIICTSELKKGKKKKEEPIADEEDELDEDETDSTSDEDSDDDEIEEEESDEEVEEDETEKLSEKELSKLQIALKVYSGKNGKKKAVEVLNKFAKTSKDVSKSQLPKLLKLLKV